MYNSTDSDEIMTSAALQSSSCKNCQGPRVCRSSYVLGSSSAYENRLTGRLSENLILDSANFFLTRYRIIVLYYVCLGLLTKDGVEFPICLIVILYDAMRCDVMLSLPRIAGFSLRGALAPFVSDYYGKVLGR